MSRRFIVSKTIPVSNLAEEHAEEPTPTLDQVNDNERKQVPRPAASIPFDLVRADPEVQAYILQANKNLGVLGFTEHGFRHVGLVASIARNVLRLLGHDRRHQELGAAAGYLHDIGNIVSRHGHASTGAMLAYPILTR